MINKELVKQKEQELEQIKEGDIINARVLGEHKRTEVLKVSRKRNGRISSIRVIYNYTSDGGIINFKMNKLDIENDIFLPDHSYQEYYDKYFFWPAYMHEEYEYGDKFEPKENVIYTKKGKITITNK